MNNDEREHRLYFGDLFSTEAGNIDIGVVPPEPNEVIWQYEGEFLMYSNPSLGLRRHVFLSPSLKKLFDAGVKLGREQKTSQLKRVLNE